MRNTSVLISVVLSLSIDCIINLIPSFSWVSIFSMHFRIPHFLRISTDFNLMFMLSLFICNNNNLQYFGPRILIPFNIEYLFNVFLSLINPQMSKYFPGQPTIRTNKKYCSLKLTMRGFWFLMSYGSTCYILMAVKA